MTIERLRNSTELANSSEISNNGDKDTKKETPPFLCAIHK